MWIRGDVFTMTSGMRAASSKLERMSRRSIPGMLLQTGFAIRNSRGWI